MNQQWFLVPVFSILALTCAAHAGDLQKRACNDRLSADECASRLSAYAELARFANYYGSSGVVRDLGYRMSVRIHDEAATRQMHLPTALNATDRRLLRTLENLQGDDFDQAYLTLTRTWRGAFATGDGQ